MVQAEARKRGSPLNSTTSCPTPGSSTSVAGTPAGRFATAIRIHRSGYAGARWLQGRSIDGKGDFQYLRDFQPVGQEPKLGAPDPRGYAQKEQMEAEGLLEKAKKIL
jgi:hypothetical protein